MKQRYEIAIDEGADFHEEFRFGTKVNGEKVYDLGEPDDVVVIRFRNQNHSYHDEIILPKIAPGIWALDISGKDTYRFGRHRCMYYAIDLRRNNKTRRKLEGPIRVNVLGGVRRG